MPNDQVKIYRATLNESIIFPKSILITSDNLGLIDLDKIIYCEISPKGAMGNEGGIIIYTLKDENTLIIYETNIEINPQTFGDTSNLIDQNANLFVNYYGGMGNYIYVKKNIQLEIDKKYNCFWYHSENTKLRIDSSVPGVFEAIISEMTDNHFNNKINSLKKYIF